MFLWTQSVAEWGEVTFDSFDPATFTLLESCFLHCTCMPIGRKVHDQIRIDLSKQPLKWTLLGGQPFQDLLQESISITEDGVINAFYQHFPFLTGNGFACTNGKHSWLSIDTSPVGPAAVLEDSKIRQRIVILFVIKKQICCKKWGQNWENTIEHTLNFACWMLPNSGVVTFEIFGCQDCPTGPLFHIGPSKSDCLQALNLTEDALFYLLSKFIRGMAFYVLKAFAIVSVTINAGLASAKSSFRRQCFGLFAHWTSIFARSNLALKRKQNHNLILKCAKSQLSHMRGQ